MITIQIDSEMLTPDEILPLLPSASTLYFWYEGSRSLPKAGAEFMEHQFLHPLLTQTSHQIRLYSLKGWNFGASRSETTPIGEIINQWMRPNLKSVYSSDFFKWCEISDGIISSTREMIRAELPTKEWLLNLSANQSPIGISVGQFMNHPSLFDGLSDRDMNQSYSALQYVEGYYLIRRAIEEQLASKATAISIVFVLPNNESRYYQDYPETIPRWLQNDFGPIIETIPIRIEIRCFRYGYTISSRPYIEKKGSKYHVHPSELKSYFQFLFPSDETDDATYSPPKFFSRLDIHHLY